MLKRFKNNNVSIDIEGKSYVVDKEVEDYIKRLINKHTYINRELSNKSQEISQLTKRLKEISAIKKEGKLKPAVSEQCIDCKYVMLSRRTGRPIACRKDHLCDDFVPANQKVED